MGPYGHACSQALVCKLPCACLGVHCPKVEVLGHWHIDVDPSAFDTSLRHTFD